MALQGQAAVAMWWHIATDQREEFLDWHTHEHLPERLGIPGFERGSRWASTANATGFFVMYELETPLVLMGADYLARLNNPTPWSQKMMPHHQRMVRSLTQVVTSHGGGLCSHLLTLRLSPSQGRESALRTWLRDALQALPMTRGLSGAHLLETMPFPGAVQTTEQRIRGGDATADWIVLVSGYSAEALQALGNDALSDGVLMAAGAKPGVERQVFSLSASLSRADVPLASGLGAAARAA
jgi:hypothetical protein